MPLRFDFIPYPLWRRSGLGRLRPLFDALSTAAVDGHPPATPAAMAHYLNRWGILPPGMSALALRDALAAMPAPPGEIARAPAVTAAPPAAPARLPAQWAPVAAVITAFPVLYPPLWQTHAAMIEAISGVARADVLLPDAAWAGAVWLFLERRGLADMTRVRLLALPTDDIWVRDYGPFTGEIAGARVLMSAAYDPLPAYPQADDDAMAGRYAAHLGRPLAAIDLHTEGGNFWREGAGTLIVSEGEYTRTRHLDRMETERRLRQAFVCDRLIVTPSLWREETGHVDLLVKLADAQTALITAAHVPFNSRALKRTREIFSREHNARGDAYRIHLLPPVAPYLNWGVFPIWRSYTNSLTVNGRVLVPIFDLATDGEALAVYQQAMPEFEIVPIRCAAAANGGGAVHCLTREVYA